MQLLVDMPPTRAYDGRITELRVEIIMPGRSFGLGNKRAAKLTGEQVLEIRERYANERACSQAMLARTYGVSVNTIASIVNGLSWRNIAGDTGQPIMPPPLNPPPPRPDAFEASKLRVLKLFDNGPPSEQPKTPSLYEDPPPEVPGQEATGIGMARLQREAAGLQPNVGNELDKLEKGD